MEYIGRNLQTFEDFYEGNLEKYIGENRPGIWAGMLELKALASKYQFNVVLHMVGQSPQFLTLYSSPGDNNFDEMAIVNILYDGEHYDALIHMNAPGNLAFKAFHVDYIGIFPEIKKDRQTKTKVQGCLPKYLKRICAFCQE